MGWWWPPSWFGSKPSITFGSQTRAVLGFKGISTHPPLELSEKYIYYQTATDERIRYKLVYGRLLAIKIGPVINFLEPPAGKKDIKDPICLLDWDDKQQTYRYRGKALKKNDVFFVNNFYMTYTKL